MTSMITALEHGSEAADADLISRILSTEQEGRLPPERDLARTLKVGRSALRGVLGQMEECGVISRQRRVGTVVNHGALENLRPPVYLGLKDPVEMEAGSARRLRNEVGQQFIRQSGEQAGDFRLVTMPHQWDHRRALADGRPTVLGGGGVHLPDAVAFGVCADLTDRVQAWSQAGEIWPNLWEASSLNGRIYGIPSSAHAFVLIANREALRRGGLPVTDLPDSWDSLREAAMRLQHDVNVVHGFGLAIDHHLAWLFEDLCYQAGGSTIEGSGDTWSPKLTSAPVCTALQWLRDLRWEDQTLLTASSTPDLVKAVAEGDCAFAMVECKSFFNEVVWNGYSPQDFVLAPLPAGPRGHRLCQLSVLVDFINAGAPEEEQDAAWRWLTTMRSPASHEKLAKQMAKHRLVWGWPSIFRQTTYAQAGANLPKSWFHMVQDVVARAKPQPSGHGWDLEVHLQPLLRRMLEDASADPALELEYAQRLVRPGMRFLH